MLRMERRQSPRLPAEEPIVVTRLSPDAQSGLSTPLAARIVERSTDGFRVELPEAIPQGMLVRLDLADSLLLGEVTWCAKAGALYYAGVRIEQSLEHMGDLRRLMAALVGERGKCLPHQSPGGAVRDEMGAREGKRREPLADGDRRCLNQPYPVKTGHDGDEER